MRVKFMMAAVLPVLLTVGAVSAQTTKPSVPASCASVLKSKVNLNKASATDLQCLPGVTKIIAKDIVLNRTFKDQHDFEVKIETIGRRLYAQIKSYVTF